MEASHESRAQLEELRILARAVVGPADADDLAHDAWIATHGRPRLMHPAWWRSVLRRRHAMRRRADARRNAREAAAGDPSTDGFDLGRQLEQAELGTALEEALGRLQPEDRDLVVSRYCEGRTAVELACTHGLSASTVRTRLARSL